MSLLPIITATMAVCPHLPADAGATFVRERDLYGIYDLVIDEYWRRALAKELAPMLGQNVSADDAECALLPNDDG